MAKKFSETQWFKLGQADVVDDGDETEASATVMMLPIEDRYADRGDLSREDRATFGLHTGTTTAIKLDAAIANVDLPDVPMTKLVREMKSRGRVFAIGASACAALTAFALYLI
ncbi:MAG TPA: hypothetical protein VFO79_06430 [Xanthomonadales bacterium]|nr:hypothetical protein [Xanthomonadales bacterium]